MAGTDGELTGRFVDVRLARGVGAFAMFLMGLLALGAFVVAVAWERAGSSRLVFAAFGIGFGGIALAIGRTRLIADVRGVHVQNLVRRTTLRWDELRSVCVVGEVTAPDSVVAVTTAGAIVTLCPRSVPWLSGGPDELDLDEAARRLRERLPSRAAPDIASLPGGTGAAGAWVPYRSTWGTILRTVGPIWLVLGVWSAVTRSWSSVIPLVVGAVWTTGATFERTPPNRTLLEADALGISWYSGDPHQVAWSDVDDLLPTGTWPRKLLVTTRTGRAHILPTPRGVAPELVAQQLVACVPHPG